MPGERSTPRPSSRWTTRATTKPMLGEGGCSPSVGQEGRDGLPHMHTISVRVGQKVTRAGHGTVGNTGLSTSPHLHFAVPERRETQPARLAGLSAPRQPVSGPTGLKALGKAPGPSRPRAGRRCSPALPAAGSAGSLTGARLPSGDRAKSRTSPTCSSPRDRLVADQHRDDGRLGVHPHGVRMANSAERRAERRSRSAPPPESGPTPPCRRVHISSRASLVREQTRNTFVDRVNSAAHASPPVASSSADTAVLTRSMSACVSRAHRHDWADAEPVDSPPDDEVAAARAGCPWLGPWSRLSR